jgi:hypothetical protein
MNKQFSEVLEKSFDSFISNIHTSMPGVIQSYDNTKKKVEVLPLVKKKFKNGQVLSFPVISNVPVIFPGTNNAIISFPLSRGDGCLIIFSERSLERFLSSNLEEVEPQDPRKFSISDAICIPGLFSFSKPGRVGDNNQLEIYYDAGTVDIQGADNFAVKYNELKSKLDALQGQLTSHVHTGVTTGPGSSGPSTTLWDVDISGAKSDKVKIG